MIVVELSRRLWDLMNEFAMSAKHSRGDWENGRGPQLRLKALFWEDRVDLRSKPQVFAQTDKMCEVRSGWHFALGDEVHSAAGSHNPTLLYLRLMSNSTPMTWRLVHYNPDHC